MHEVLHEHALEEARWSNEENVHSEVWNASVLEEYALLLVHQVEDVSSEAGDEVRSELGNVENLAVSKVSNDEVDKISFCGQTSIPPRQHL